MSLALCSQVVSQTPQHFTSSKMQTTCGGCFAHKSLCSVISLLSSMSRAVQPQEFPMVDVEYWHMQVWVSHFIFHFEPLLKQLNFCNVACNIKPNQPAKFESDCSWIWIHWKANGRSLLSPLLHLASTPELAHLHSVHTLSPLLTPHGPGPGTLGMSRSRWCLLIQFFCSAAILHAKSWWSEHYRQPLSSPGVNSSWKTTTDSAESAATCSTFLMSKQKIKQQSSNKKHLLPITHSHMIYPVTLHVHAPFS